jgi:ribose transport system permease protein
MGNVSENSRFLGNHDLKSTLSKISKNYAILIATILMGAIFSFASPYFFSFDNIRNIFLQSSTIAVVAIGQALIILTGEFDLSIGQNVCVSSALAAYLMKFQNWNPWVAVLVGIGVGSLIGLTNGVLIAYAKIPCFIATLAMQNIGRGFAKIITNATPIPSLPKELDFIGRGFVGGKQYGIPVSVIIMIVFYIVFTFISRRTKLGRGIYAIGGSSEAAYFAGINVRKYRVYTYTIAGALAGIGGIILISRLNSASVTNGNLYEFDAIIASIMGGISLAGGKGRVVQAMFGAIFLTLFFNGMTMLNVHPFYQDVIKGVVLVVAIGIDLLRNKK